MKVIRTERSFADGRSKRVEFHTEDGRHHNDDGPAMTYCDSNGAIEYQGWYHTDYNREHRLSGPAREWPIRKDGYAEYWLEGDCVYSGWEPQTGEEVLLRKVHQLILNRLAAMLWMREKLGTDRFNDQLRMLISECRHQGII